MINRGDFWLVNFNSKGVQTARKPRGGPLPTQRRTRKPRQSYRQPQRIGVVLVGIPVTNINLFVEIFEVGG
jgi:hypothetical protein